MMIALTGPKAPPPPWYLLAVCTSVEHLDSPLISTELS